MNTPAQPSDAIDEKPSFGLPVDLTRIWRALWRARLWFLVMFIVGAAGGVVLAKLLLPNSYRAQTVLRYDGMAKLPGVPEPDETALPEFEASFTADPVLDSLKKRIGSSSTLKALKRKVETSSSDTTGTVAVAFADPDAEKSLEGVKALVDEVADYRREQRQDVVRSYLERNERRETKQAADVASIRERYKEFRKEHGIADLSAEKQDGLRSVATMQAKRDLAEADIKALEAQVRQAETQIKNTPAMEVASSSVRNPDADRLAMLESQLAQARSSLSEQHPRVLALDLQVRNLRKRVQSGEAKSVSSNTMTRSSAFTSAKAQLAALQGQLSAAREQYSSLSGLAEDAQTKMKRYGEIEGQAITYMSQLEVAESLLAEMRADNAKLTAAMQAPESGFTVISEAQLPDEPVENKARKKLALIVPLLLMLLVAVQALARELWGARILSPNELGFWGKGPVLAASKWPRDPSAFDELVADFDDCAPYAQGETLMVAASDGVLEATGQLARRLHGDWFDNALVVEPAEPTRLPRTRALASGEKPAPRVTGNTIELWRASPDNEAEPDREAENGSRAGRRAANGGPAPMGGGRVLAWSGGMDGHGLRRAARLADRVVVLVESGVMNPMTLKAVRAAIARESGVGYILVSTPEGVSQGHDRIGPVREFWGALPAR